MLQKWSMIAARSQHQGPGTYLLEAEHLTDGQCCSVRKLSTGVVHSRRHRICCCCGDRESRGQPHNNRHDMVFRHRHEEWFAWCQERRSGSAYHVCSLSVIHWCSKGFCSRLGNPFSPGFPTGSTNPGLKVPSFSPGLAPGTKGGPLVPVGNTNRD